jgi:hypothetical protein
MDVQVAAKERREHKNHGVSITSLSSFFFEISASFRGQKPKPQRRGERRGREWLIPAAQASIIPGSPINFFPSLRPPRRCGSGFLMENWWVQLESNQHLRDYEPRALPLSYRPLSIKKWTCAPESHRVRLFCRQQAPRLHLAHDVGPWAALSNLGSPTGAAPVPRRSQCRMLAVTLWTPCWSPSP